MMVTNFVFGQIPQKEKILKAYYVGHLAFEALQTLNHESINVYFKDSLNLSFITHGMESKKFHEDSLKIAKAVMYNQETGKYEFLIYGGDFVESNDSDVTLFDYQFVIQLEINLNKEGIENQITKTTIFKESDQDDLKNWWRNYMRSYGDPKYAKKEIADKYGLVPPPPPPAQSKDWF